MTNDTFEDTFGISLNELNCADFIWTDFEFNYNKFSQYIKYTYSYDSKYDGSFETFIKENFGTSAFKMVQELKSTCHPNQFKIII